jgi:hypothetical protein
MRGAIAAAHTLLGIDLPDGAFGSAPESGHPGQSAQSSEAGGARAFAQELAAGDGI